ncbi:MAG: hypothetical protein ABIB97_00450 [Patescibacteria group bacterium]
MNNKLKIQSDCPFCGSEYDMQSLHVLEERGSGFLAHLKCMNCHGAVVTLVSMSPLGGLLVTGVATDLQESEVLGFEKGEEVSYDDVINIHGLLENNGELFIDVN